MSKKDILLEEVDVIANVETNLITEDDLEDSIDDEILKIEGVNLEMVDEYDDEDADDTVEITATLSFSKSDIDKEFKEEEK